jgi:3-phosphoshikimate 1-carboxyvinyltransferase
VSNPLPDPFEVPHGLPAQGDVEAPRSKSHAIRLLVTAALAEGTSTISGVPEADDVLAVTDSLRALGVELRTEAGEAVVRGCGGRLPAVDGGGAVLHLGGSGTGLRFLTAICCLGDGPYVLDGDAFLRARPLGSVAEIVRGLGCRVRDVEGCPPVQVTGGPVVTIPLDLRCPDMSMSSQPVSALLLVTAAVPGESVAIHLPESRASVGYVELTRSVLERFGVRFAWGRTASGGLALTRHGGRLCSTGATVEGDWSSAAYLLAASAVSGGDVRVRGLRADSAQPDREITGILERMGARVTSDGHATGCRGLAGTAVSLQGSPDLAPLVGALGCVAGGITEVTDTPHLRIKESDRIASTVAAARAIGCRAEERPDGFVIHGGGGTGGVVDPRGDHRIAMAFAVAGLAIPGVRIRDPGCVSKSYPGFWRDLARLTGEG